MKGWGSTLGVACLLLLALAAPGRAAGPVRIAILPLQVNALDRHEYLRDGLSDMLSSRIGRIPGVSVVRVQDPKLATRQAPTARATAREVGADYVVYGSFTAFGGGASLDLECSAVGTPDGPEPTAKSVFVQAGALGDIIPQLDELSARVGRFALGGNGAETPPVAAAPPAAPPKAGPAPDAAELHALEERVKALERVVFSQPKEATAPPEAADAHRGSLSDE